MWSGLLYATLMNAEVFIVILKEGVTVHSILLLLIPWIMLVSGTILFCHSWSAHYYCDTNCLALCLNLEMLLNEHNVLKLKERGYCHLCLKKNYRYCCLISLGIG